VETIAIGVEINRGYIILDDYVARREARKLGLEIKGTLGIIRKLMKEKIIKIKDINKFYKRLEEINFRIKKEIVKEIFKDLVK